MFVLLLALISKSDRAKVLELATLPDKICVNAFLLQHILTHHPWIILKLYLFTFVETPRKFIIAKFSWCFHKAKQVYCLHHANVQET